MPQATTPAQGSPAGVPTGTRLYYHIEGTVKCDDSLRRRTKRSEEGFCCCQCGVGLTKEREETHSIELRVEAHLYEVEVGSSVVRAVLLPACTGCNLSEDSQAGWFPRHRRCIQDPVVISGSDGEGYQIEDASFYERVAEHKDRKDYLYGDFMNQHYDCKCLAEFGDRKRSFDVKIAPNGNPKDIHLWREATVCTRQCGQAESDVVALHVARDFFRTVDAVNGRVNMFQWTQEQDVWVSELKATPTETWIPIDECNCGAGEYFSVARKDIVVRCKGGARTSRCGSTRTNETVIKDHKLSHAEYRCDLIAYAVEKADNWCSCDKGAQEKHANWLNAFLVANSDACNRDSRWVNNNVKKLLALSAELREARPHLPELLKREQECHARKDTLRLLEYSTFKTNQQQKIREKHANHVALHNILRYERDFAQGIAKLKRFRQLKILRAQRRHLTHRRGDQKVEFTSASEVQKQIDAADQELKKATERERVADAKEIKEKKNALTNALELVQLDEKIKAIDKKISEHGWRPTDKDKEHMRKVLDRLRSEKVEFHKKLDELQQAWEEVLEGLEMTKKERRAETEELDRKLARTEHAIRDSLDDTEPTDCVLLVDELTQPFLTLLEGQLPQIRAASGITCGRLGLCRKEYRIRCAGRKACVETAIAQVQELVKKMKEFQHQIKIPKGVMFDEIVGPDGETIRVIRALSPEATIFITQRERWVWLEGSKHGVFTACQLLLCLFEEIRCGPVVSFTTRWTKQLSTLVQENLRYLQNVTDCEVIVQPEKCVIFRGREAQINVAKSIIQSAIRKQGQSRQFQRR